jgi:stage II sporulation protein M
MGPNRHSPRHRGNRNRGANLSCEIAASPRNPDDFICICRFWCHVSSGEGNLADGLAGLRHSIKQTLRMASPLIAVSLVLFLLATVTGLLRPDLAGGILSAFQEIAEDLLQRSTPELIFAIFLRNGTAAVLSIFLGIAFGILPAAAILINGLLFGAVLQMAPGDIWRVLPHGIFELPAMFMAWGLGLWVGQWFLQPPRLEHLKDRLGRSLKVLLLLILPLLALAAVIEGLAAALYFR